jgi:DNA-binding HxlR family transcriptional regulator
MENIDKLICALEKHREIMGTKWITVLLYTINKYPVKFNKLRQVLPTISARALSISLTTMQNKELIIKEEYLYSITIIGDHTLEATLDYIKKLEKIEL